MVSYNTNCVLWAKTRKLEYSKCSLEHPCCFRRSESQAVVRGGVRRLSTEGPGAWELKPPGV